MTREQKVRLDMRVAAERVKWSRQPLTNMWHLQILIDVARAEGFHREYEWVFDALCKTVNHPSLRN